MREGVTMSATECNAISKGLLGDTLGFLSSNVVQTGTDPETGIPTSATRSFDFNDQGPTKQGGRVYDHAVPDNMNLINGLLDVYYLPWGRNAGYYVILEPEGGPDIMMTATLSGCSVGYVRADDGAVRVSHHNISGPGGTRTQLTTLAFAENAFHPDEYREGAGYRVSGETAFSEDGFGFVFGVRRKRQWTMYRQRIITSKAVDKWEGTFLSYTVIITGAGVF
jgi:hypothetical protein